MARDMYHETVKAALIEDGWEITADPYLLKVEFIDYEADLGAESAAMALAIELSTPVILTDEKVGRNQMSPIASINRRI